MNDQMRFMKRAALSGPLALALIALAIGPAAAADGSFATNAGRPDGLVRFKSYQSAFGTYPDPSPWIGGDIYNTTGRNQTHTVTALGTYERDTHLVFVVAIENEGPADRVGIKASGTGSWSVAYFDGRTEVTRSIVDGTYRTRPLSAGERAYIKVKVRLGRPGSSLMRHLLLTSASDPDRQDAVRVRASYSSCSC